jgi:predicted GIY-YIG superfamily endonuclease
MIGQLMRAKRFMRVNTGAVNLTTKVTVEFFYGCLFLIVIDRNVNYGNTGTVNAMALAFWDGAKQTSQVLPKPIIPTQRTSKTISGAKQTSQVIPKPIIPTQRTSKTISGAKQTSQVISLKPNITNITTTGSKGIPKPIISTQRTSKIISKSIPKPTIQTQRTTRTLRTVPNPTLISTVNKTIQKTPIPKLSIPKKLIPKLSNANTSIPNTSNVNTKFKSDIIPDTNITSIKFQSELLYKKKAGVYILELSGGFIYVGKSNNIPNRIAQHMTGKGARFTRVFKPTGKILPRIGNVQCEIGDAAERDETLRQMYKHGVDRVRGWKFCSRKLRSCDRVEIESNIRELFDLCRKCGKAGHFAAFCTTRQHRI